MIKLYNTNPSNIYVTILYIFQVRQTEKNRSTNLISGSYTFFNSIIKSIKNSQLKNKWYGGINQIKFAPNLGANFDNRTVIIQNIFVTTPASA